LRTSIDRAWIAIMPRSIRILLSLAFLCAAATSAGAQPLSFAGMPWRMPVDSVRTRLEGMGYTFSREIEPADPVFAREDGGELTVYLQDRRVVGFILVDSARDDGAEQRYRTLADSLRATLGPGDTLGTTGLVWASGLTEIRLLTVNRLGVKHVTLEWRGPGMLDEMTRRWADRPLPPLPEHFTAVTGTAVSRVAVDTTSLRRTAGSLHGRFRVDYAQPVGPESGSFDSVQYELAVDCARKRARLVARSMYRGGVLLRGERWLAQAWEDPQPDGHHGRGLVAICRAADFFGVR
jgi:hypothetical protein